MDEIEIRPMHRPLDATVEIPGSKSITNRALVLGALARGRSVVESPLLSDDTERMIAALRELGFAVEIEENLRRLTIEGRGGVIPAARAELFVGNAGTVMRFLAGMLTLGRGRYRLDGDARMRERPIGELVESLRALGVDALSEFNNGCPPIVISPGNPCAGGSATIDARLSSQFVSALLMPAPLWKKGLRLKVIGEVARPFVDMTLSMMKRWGAAGAREDATIVVAGGQSYRPQNYRVEPDASSASYFAAAAALCGGVVRILKLRRDSVQGDIGFLELLEQMGASVTWSEEGVEIRGTSELRGIDADMSAMPDMVPTLAAIAPFASPPTTIRNVAFIRHHESDRIRALAAELRRLGATVQEREDGLTVSPSKLHQAAIETYDDHRIAMAFAVVGLKLGGVRIKDPACVSKTFPDFFSKLASLTA